MSLSLSLSGNGLIDTQANYCKSIAIAQWKQGISVCDDTNNWVQLTSMVLFTLNDAKHQRKKMQTLTLTVNRPLTLADPGGWGQPPPPSDQILSFVHTNFPECHHIGPWQLPYGSASPLREILDPPLLKVGEF